MNKEKRVPDWMWERYLLDELPRKKRRQLDKLLERDPALRAGLEKLRLSDRQILSSYPPERMIPEILRRAALDRPRADGVPPLAPGLGGGAGAGAGGLPAARPAAPAPAAPGAPRERRSGDYTAMKGDAPLTRPPPRCSSIAATATATNGCVTAAPPGPATCSRSPLFPGSRPTG